MNILRDAKPPIIIFANEKNAVEKLSKVLDKWGVSKLFYILARNLFLSFYSGTMSFIMEEERNNKEKLL
jgi:hypothetical protein